MPGSKPLRWVLGVCLVLAPGWLAGCNGSGSAAECEKDGDCPNQFWRCDAYAKICRCVDDQACATAAGERCMPDGTCQLYTGCSSDQECGSCNRCEQSTGECLCTDDCACAEGEFCNSSGFCQPKSGCFDNADCAASEYCDTGSKTCAPAGTCTTKYQCPLGQICTSGACVDGCEDHGDCPYHWACMNGTCQQGVCPDDSFCDFMEACFSGTCTSAYDDQYAPYCKPCQNSDLAACGTTTNPCLVYPFQNDAFANAGNTDYCGVDCSGGQRCPNGFVCSSIITVKQTDICQVDSDCPGGLPCLKPEEEDTGFCPCHPQYNACPNNICVTGDTCSQYTGTCLALQMSGITLHCQQNSDCNICSVTVDHCTTNADCQPIQCEIYDGVDYGGCVSAQACGLADGMHCQP